MLRILYLLISLFNGVNFCYTLSLVTYSNSIRFYLELNFEFVIMYSFFSPLIRYLRRQHFLPALF